MQPIIDTGKSKKCNSPLNVSSDAFPTPALFVLAVFKLPTSVQDEPSQVSALTVKLPSYPPNFSQAVEIPTPRNPYPLVFTSATSVQAVPL